MPFLVRQVEPAAMARLPPGEKEAAPEVLSDVSILVLNNFIAQLGDLRHQSDI